VTAILARPHSSQFRTITPRTLRDPSPAEAARGIAFVHYNKNFSVYGIGAGDDQRRRLAHMWHGELLSTTDRYDEALA
jgi:hypothetical protein